jgi:hypothetical protein
MKTWREMCGRIQAEIWWDGVEMAGTIHGYILVMIYGYDGDIVD